MTKIKTKLNVRSEEFFSNRTSMEALVADLKKKYGVVYQHTFVQVDKDGNLIKKWSGSPNLSSLVTQVN